jgi:hypothetical protein
MPNNYCQTFKQKIEKLKGKAQSIEGLLLEYRNTGKEEIVQQLERELEGVLQEIEEFKEEFKDKATQLIEEFIQRRDNKNDRVEIIFDEEDYRFIIEGNFRFSYRTHLDDFPNLIREIQGSLLVPQVQTLDLPKLRKAEYILADNAQTINLPNLEEVLGIQAFQAQTLDLPKLRKASDIYVSNAQTINLPNLEEAYNIRVYRVQTLDLSKLRKARSILAFNAQTINLPNLEEAWYISANSAQTLDLPKLKKAQSIYANNAQAINLPNIIELRDIYFYENNPNLESLSNQARELRTRGILKGKIKIVNKRGEVVREL